MNIGRVDTSSTPVNGAAKRRADASCLKDSDKMTFGKHRGERLSSVPDGYLRWLWENGKSQEDSPLARYIEKRLRVKRAEFVSPHPVQYFAVLANEPLHPEWEDIFGQHAADDGIPF